MDIQTWRKEIADIRTLEDLEHFRLKSLGKNGFITQQLKNLSNLSVEEKKIQGSNLNLLKDEILQEIAKVKKKIDEETLLKRLENEVLDVTLPPSHQKLGTYHPITKTIQNIKQYFYQFGFQVEEGPDLDNEENNFDALNIPKHHPARQNHDTFFIKDSDLLLRTHTSNVQIRTLKSKKPPLKILSFGRVYRSDYDATHTPMFHQLEGLVIDENIHMGHLKATIINFVRWFFDVKDLPVRLRPSFFPFTEPSAELDIGCKRTENSLEIGNFNDWLEILGCGMVHPNVLANCGIDPEKYQGFAFGLGIDRLAMLKYGINDIRRMFEGDTRWLQAFGEM